MLTAVIVHLLLIAEREGPAVLARYLWAVSRKADGGDREAADALRVWAESRGVCGEVVHG